MFIKWVVFAVASCSFAETFAATQIEVIGSIYYGQTSLPVRYTGSPKYRAFEFNAKPGDQLEIWVHARRGAPKAFLTDNRFQSIAGGKSHFSATVPLESQPATYYVVFYELNYKRGEFTLELQRPSPPR